MEVAGRQHLGLARLEPAFGLVGMAFWTTPIFAGVIRKTSAAHSSQRQRCPPRASVRRQGYRRWRADGMAASTRHGPTGNRPRSGGRRPRSRSRRDRRVRSRSSIDREPLAAKRWLARSGGCRWRWWRYWRDRAEFGRPWYRYHSPADGSHNCASGRAAAPVV